MGRTSRCIEMLQMLNSGRIIKISEFAEKFETNPRNIIEYRKELEEAGYTIEIITGKYGGYKLDKTNLIPTIKLLPEQKVVLKEAFDYVLSKKDFVKKDEFIHAFSKVSSAIQLPTSDEQVKVVDHYQISMNEKDVADRYNFIEEMIKTKYVIEIQYNSLKNGLKKHILHPYKLFIYNNAWFFLAWNPEAGDVWTFKLNRIESFKKINEKFKVWKYFKPEDYIQDNNLSSNGEFYHIEYLATGVRKVLASERVYGKNQKVETIDEDTVKVSLDMQHKEMIVSYFLSCGTDVTVLEPKWLIEELEKICLDIMKKYEK